jgi:hypothetical protein
MDDIKIGLHVFLIVLIFGTIWRLGSLYLIASPSAHLSHLGRAMSQQY